jgi:hypothetical protein
MKHRQTISTNMAEQILSPKFNGDKSVVGLKNIENDLIYLDVSTTIESIEVTESFSAIA